MSYKASQAVTDYIARSTPEVQERLTTLRHLIWQYFPDTIEDISYQMPTYRPAAGKRGLIHFSAATKHIGMYPIFDPADNTPIEAILKKYRSGRATAQFMHHQPFPLEDIKTILAYQASVTKQ